MGRLTAGLWHKAAKGELCQGLPVGYGYDHTEVVVSPDEAVVEAIATEFRRFDELGSARQVLLSLLEEGCSFLDEAPTKARVRWAKADLRAVHDLLTNPCYAGASDLSGSWGDGGELGLVGAAGVEQHSDAQCTRLVNPERDPR